MSLEYITKVLKVEVNSTQKLILIVLANYSDEFGQSYPSHRKLTELTNLSLTAIKDNLKKLKEIGYLDWEKRNNTSNLYKLKVSPSGGYPPPSGGYNTKGNTKQIYILDLDRINEIYKEQCDKVFYQHSANSFKANTRWKELRELGRKGIISPKTGKKIDLTTEEFWYKYFEIANSDGHKKWIRSFWAKKPTLMTMIGLNQFEAIIERRYG
ncbi:helix-turn-helix domain-containing protein [Candidatus Poseidoniales archaeon]|nr:helix-turn-helix domain-containing protein [Candidatus Poseidoniales archaeon]